MQIQLHGSPAVGKSPAFAMPRATTPLCIVCPQHENDLIARRYRPRTGMHVKVASAQKLVPYDQIGGDKTEWVRWDTHVIDASSLQATGSLLKYKTIRIATSGSEPAQEMLADCRARTRGQPPDPVMRSTYEGTLGGEEVKRACALAEKAGLKVR